MFYKITLEKLVTVPPEKLDAALHRHLLQFLRDAVVGQLVPPPAGGSAIQQEYHSAAKSSAIVLAVIDIPGAENLQGKVLDNGSVSFFLRYDALVLKVHRGEVLDVLVESVIPQGWVGSVYGAGKVYVSKSQMSSDPLQEEWSFESGVAEGSWISKDGTRSIKVNEIVRIRVLGETPQSLDAMIVGTMAGAHLGPL
eukprot:gene13297-9135_t